MAYGDHYDSDRSYGWYTVVSWGAGYGGPCGPWKSAEAAREAVDRYSARRGVWWGEETAASNARIVGPFRTRRLAQRADISDAPVVCSC